MQGTNTGGVAPRPPSAKPRRGMRRYATAAAPFLVVGALVYGGMYVKPVVKDVDLRPAVVERGDYMYGAVALGAGRLLAVGSNGKIWTSGVPAIDWRAARSPLDSTLQDVAAWDARRAVAVGDRGAVIVSGDGGQRWTRVAAPLSKVANKLLQVVAIPGGGAWAVGEAGAVLKSADYGHSWVRARAEQDIAWNGVAVQGERVWLVGEFGNISFSDNGGASWKQQSSPARGSLMAVAFRDAMSGIAVGVDGVVLATSDGGASWTRRPLAAKDHLYDVVWDGARWLAAGDKGLVAAAAPDAADWRVLDIRDNDRRWHTAIVALPQGAVLAGASLLAFK